MQAHAGDELVVRSHRLGGPDRRGRIVEARGPDGGAPFLVCWDETGRTALVFPGSDAEIVRTGHPADA